MASGALVALIHRVVATSPNAVTGFLIGHGRCCPGIKLRQSQFTVRSLGDGGTHIDCRWGDNELAMVDHMRQQMQICIAAGGGDAYRSLRVSITLPEALLKGPWPYRMGLPLAITSMR